MRNANEDFAYDQRQGGNLHQSVQPEEPIRPTNRMRVMMETMKSGPDTFVISFKPTVI